MVTGTLIAESLRVGAELNAVPLHVTRIWRGDEAGRAAALGHAAKIGIPEDQMDWSV
jgi:hypothetical protein